MLSDIISRLEATQDRELEAIASAAKALGCTWDQVEATLAYARLEAEREACNRLPADCDWPVKL